MHFQSLVFAKGVFDSGETRCMRTVHQLSSPCPRVCSFVERTTADRLLFSAGRPPVDPSGGDLLERQRDQEVPTLQCEC